MQIEQFFLKSVGVWNSMRSGHTLAFQEFEEIRSKIKISHVNLNDLRVKKLLTDNSLTFEDIKKAFLISWEAKSEWDDETQRENSNGQSILIPLESSKTEGKIIRSTGYTEAINLVSLYKFLEDETLIIYSNYNQIYTEERIWFVSDNLRSRSSVSRAINSSAIIQTSYASEIRCFKT
tara:strand:- start:69 stop:602 length:534 start_codon:yes stop_codon:yes gene_type:complete